ncbi:MULTISPECIES: four-carbon acid sugar kinase family protein [unclassified Ensifer]|uniref:four-carbon acid sugar kinase family protein n=1 Tax=unclassified Ensifer TaxID=2633371 RepID=UPI0030104A27
MLLGAIADDFTRASDLTHFVGPGTGKPDCEAGVVALKTRTVPVNEAVSRSLEAVRWLVAQGCYTK